MGMKHYEGELGTFDYNDAEFTFKGVKGVKHLIYIGKETDGSKIHIPEGITNIDYMFYKSNLKSAPDINDGIESCNYTFYDSKALTGAATLDDYGKNIIVIPDSVKSGICMFTKCRNITYHPRASRHFKDMYYGCHPFMPENRPAVNDNVEYGYRTTDEPSTFINASEWR